MRRFINGICFYSLSVIFLFRDHFRAVTLPLLVGMVLVFALISLLPLGQSIPLAILVGVLQHSSCAQWARAENLRERLEDEIDAQIEACEASQ